MRVNIGKISLTLGVSAFLAWMLLISICAVNSWETNRNKIPEVGTAIGVKDVTVYPQAYFPAEFNNPTEVAYVDIDTRALILTTYAIIECTLVGETYRPEALLKIVSEGADISDFFRTDIYGVTGLKVIINDEIYWLRLWKEE